MTPINIVIFILIAAIIVGVLFLLFYILQGYFNKKNRVPHSLKMVLLHIAVQKERGKQIEETRDPKELAQLFIGEAEQFFASLYGIYEKKSKKLFSSQESLSFEIVAQNDEISFYVSVPKKIRNLIEKQIHAYYSDAQIETVKEYNIFKPDSKVAAVSLALNKSYFYPIKTYKNLEVDPLNGLANALGKLGKDEGAAIQILVRPVSEKWRANGKIVAKRIQEGKSAKAGASIVSKFMSNLGSWLNYFFKHLLHSEQSGTHDDSIKLTPMQESTIQALEEKTNKVGFETNIRLVVASPLQESAQSQLETIVSSFSQFNVPEYNGFKKEKIKSQADLVTAFIFRFFNPTETILNTEELATVFHFPNFTVDAPKIRWLLSKQSHPPSNLPASGVPLGESIYRGESKNVYLKDGSDRRRHIYIIGKTGTGKSNLLANMINYDIEKGHGVCVIDPNGDLIEEGILPRIPKERSEDLIYFNPADMQRPMGLNLFEFRKPEEKDFLIQELIVMLYKLYDPGHTGIIGPMFEHWIRNASLPLMSDPAGGTIIDIPRMFTDPKFVEEKLKYVSDPAVLRFWREEMPQTGGERKGEVQGWVIAKFGAFMTNEMMRNIMGQVKSGFNLRDIMDSKKILLCNLSKGKVGELNSNLLGMILVTKIQMATMGRADIPADKRSDFFLYVDEFQNFATESFVSILSEARKYGLALIVANQFIGQVPEEIKNAIFGNVGSEICFTIGVEDAEYMAKEFEPVFDRQDLINVPRFNAYVSLLIDGTESRPFNIHTLKDPNPGDMEVAKSVIQLSRLKYGKDREMIEKEIFERAKIGGELEPEIPR
jgi:hypothetical protein